MLLVALVVWPLELTLAPLRWRPLGGGDGYLGLDIFSAEMGMNLRVLNVYTPCNQREKFWQRLLHLNLMDEEQTIICGDLNFSLGFRESWGSAAQIDSITDYMTSLLEQTNFVDVPMHKLLPTWRNRRVGDAALACRLDRFIMKDTLLKRLHHYKQWVGTGGISDHSPIYLEIQGPFKKPKAPFKFNHTWLKDPSYVKMISEYWINHPINGIESFAKGFCRNLSEIKHLSIKWAKDKQARDTSQLINIESELSALTNE